jgi:hypothetical protein
LEGEDPAQRVPWSMGTRPTAPKFVGRRYAELAATPADRA